MKYGSRKFLISLISILFIATICIIYGIKSGSMGWVYIAGIGVIGGIVFSYCHYNVKELGIIEALKDFKDVEKD